MSDEHIPPRPDPLYPAEVPSPRGTSGRPRASWRWWEALAVYFLGLLAAGALTLPLLMAIHSRSLARLVVSVAGDGFLAGVMVGWLSRFHPRWKEVIGFPRRPGPEVRAGLLYGLALYPVVVFGVGAVLDLVLHAVSGRSVRAPQQLPSNLGGGRVALAALLAVVVAPASEELFFRGCLFRALRDRYGFAVGAGGSGIAFGLAHYIPGPWQSAVLLMSVMVFTGVCLAYLYERRGNLLASIVAHATFNLVGLTLILAVR